jgi:hypothetical protein
VHSHRKRIFAAASRMRTCRPAAQLRRRFAGQTRLRLTAQSRRASQLERHTFAPAIALGRFAVGKAKLDLCERIASAGPSGQRINARTPALRETQPPCAFLGATGLVDRHRHGLDDCEGIGRQGARMAGARPAIVVGGERPSLPPRPARLEARPRTEVPGLPVMPPCH